jgi:hypothetical protein
LYQGESETRSRAVLGGMGSVQDVGEEEADELEGDRYDYCAWYELTYPRPAARNSRFQKKPKKLPVGIPSINISSPLIELDNGPNGEFEDGNTTVVSQ